MVTDEGDVFMWEGYSRYDMLAGDKASLAAKTPPADRRKGSAPDTPGSPARSVPAPGGGAGGYVGGAGGYGGKEHGGREHGAERGEKADRTDSAPPSAGSSRKDRSGRGFLERFARDREAGSRDPSAKLLALLAMQANNTILPYR